MLKKEICLYYGNLRRIQSKIVQQNFFQTEDLFKYLNKDCVKIYATYLTDFYFHRSKKLEIYNLIYDLYRLFLVIAPILQKQKNSFKLDWNRAIFLSWLRSNCNKKVNKKYIRVEKKERRIEPDRLIKNFLEMGIKDSLLIEFAIDCFKKNYTLETLRGRLANCIFDPIIFFSDKGEKGFRRANEIIRLEKKKFPICVDIDKEDVILWNYKIRRITNNTKTTLRIEISDQEIKRFKQEIKLILNSKLNFKRKIFLLENKIESFVHRHKYTKDAWDQFLDLKYWLLKKTKNLAAMDKTTKFTINILLKWKNERCDKMFFRKPNFFWNAQDVEEENYKYFFSPYREEG
jgi:hypothetical protein